MRFRNYEHYKQLCLKDYNGWTRGKPDKNNGQPRARYQTEIIDWCNQKNPHLVIDCGCDINFWKGKIKNLVGFEIRDIPGPDYVGSYRDMDSIFEPESADIILCFGSISFGTRDIVEEHLSLIVKWAKPGAYFIMRVKKYGGQMMYEPSFDLHYFWSEKDIAEWGEKFGLKRIPLFYTPVWKNYAHRYESKIEFIWQKR